MHVELRLALDAAGAGHAVHHALHVNAGGNHDAVADDDGKRGREVDAVAGLGAPGVDGAAQLEQNLGAGGNGVGLLCRDWDGRLCIGCWARWLRQVDWRVPAGRAPGRTRRMRRFQMQALRQRWIGADASTPPGSLVPIDETVAPKDSVFPGLHHEKCARRAAPQLDSRYDARQRWSPKPPNSTQVPPDSASGSMRCIACWRRPSRRGPSPAARLACLRRASAAAGCAGDIHLRGEFSEGDGRDCLRCGQPDEGRCYDGRGDAARISAACWTWRCRSANCCRGSWWAREPGSQARKVTLRHLLAHNSGLPGYVEFFRAAATAAGAAARLPGVAVGGGAGNARGVLRPRVHPAGQGAGCAEPRVPCHMGAAGGV